jgi:hypothetical protein
MGLPARQIRTHPHAQTFRGVLVTTTNAGPATRLDGMVITGGLAIHGGGVAMVGSGPVLANNTVTANTTDGAGAGISIWGFQLISSMTLEIRDGTSTTTNRFYRLDMHRD